VFTTLVGVEEFTYFVQHLDQDYGTGKLSVNCLIGLILDSQNFSGGRFWERSSGSGNPHYKLLDARFAY